MKRLVLITYKLSSDWFNYCPFFEKIKTLCPDNQHVSDGTWIVYTDMSAKELQEELFPLLYVKPKNGERQENFTIKDRLFICEMGKDFAGFTPTCLWPWIKNRQEEN